MNKDWLKIYTDVNQDLSMLEILALGECNGVTLRASKKVDLKTLKEVD